MWHPGGAHPFIGLNEALVHNGDFANYHSVGEYLPAAQHPPAVPHRHRGLGPALRPVGPRLQVPAGVHHRGPGPDDGAGLRPAAAGEAADLPADPGGAHPRLARRPVVLHHRPQPGRDRKQFQLLGITDTAMLRPQVFALSGRARCQIGLICSEKQAIDATLAQPGRARTRGSARGRHVLERPRRQPHRRRGVHLHRRRGRRRATSASTCTDKFGRPVTLEVGDVRCDLPTGPTTLPAAGGRRRRCATIVGEWPADAATSQACSTYACELPAWPAGDLRRLLLAPSCEAADSGRQGPRRGHRGPDAAARPPLRHRRQATQPRCCTSSRQSLERLFDAAPLFGDAGDAARTGGSTGTRRDRLRGPQRGEEVLVIDAEKFPPEGDDCDAVAAARGLPPRLAAVHRLPLPRPAVHTACGLGPGHRRRAHRRLRHPAATTWPAASTAWRSTSTATPRTSSARS